MKTTTAKKLTAFIIMMKQIFLICMFFIGLGANAQVTFQKTYGYGEGNCARQTTDGGYIICGNSYNFGAGNADVYLIKTNSTGDTLWTKTYGSTSYEAGYSVRQTTDGGYIIAAASGNRYLIKTNNVGDTMWTKSFSIGEVYSIKQTSDGGYIMASRYQNFFTSFYFSLTKTDSMGTLLWSKLITTAPFQRCISYDVQQTTDGGYIAVGNINAVTKVCLVKTDANGNVLWLKIYGGTEYSKGLSVQLTNDNGYIITGYTGFGAGIWDVLLLKTDSSGSVLWSKAYGGAGEEGGSSVQQTMDGGYVIAGYTNSFGAGNEDIYLVKTDGSGNLLWSKTYGGPGDESYEDNYYSVQQTTDGGYIIANSTTSFGPSGFDVYLIKTDSLGNSGCNESNPATITTSLVTPVVTQPSAVTNNVATTTLITTVGGGGIATTLCIPTGDKEIGDIVSSFNISPNPATSELRIENAELRIKKVEMFDVFGKCVYNSAFDIHHSALSIDVSKLSPGIYFVCLANEKEQVVRKVVVGR